MSEALRVALTEAKQTITQQAAVIERLIAKPLAHSTIVDVEDKAVTVTFEGRLMQVERPEWDIASGDSVLLNMDSLQIAATSPFEHSGAVAVLRTLVDERMIEIEIEDHVSVIHRGAINGAEPGDRLVIDTTGVVALRNLGKSQARFNVTTLPRVEWNEIGGHEAAKLELIEAIDESWRTPDLLTRYGRKPIKGILLYGPPGCGKTLLAKAVGTAMADIHGGDLSGFFYVKGPELLSQWVGVAEAGVRNLFARTREFKRMNGYPAVVFIDESEAILGRRGSGISSDVETTIVPMFLTEWDGLDQSDALFLLATNRPDRLDPAVVRDKRIDRRIKVARPDYDTSQKIFELYLGRVPKARGQTTARLARAACDDLFAESRVLYRVVLNDDTTRDMTLADLVNGAMVEGIVDRATTTAMRRERLTGDHEGICAADLTDAVEAVSLEMRGLDHTDEIAEFIEGWEDQVTKVRRLRAA